MAPIMALQAAGPEVGVRELHNRLSHYLGLVEDGAEIVVTRHGQRIAVLSAVDREDPLEELIRQGKVRPPTGPGTKLSPPTIRPKGSVSELVKDQRR